MGSHGFNTQPPEGGCVNCVPSQTAIARFQHTATRRWLQRYKNYMGYARLFQHTATRRWLPTTQTAQLMTELVSTHSHPKVAALIAISLKQVYSGFNTQPPEGGCLGASGVNVWVDEFQHTATRRWLRNSRGGRLYATGGFNTQPPEGGCLVAFYLSVTAPLFQHTATRRWLLSYRRPLGGELGVSTHSHPKVAAPNERGCYILTNGFNTQPPEGGCWVRWHNGHIIRPFQHTATRRWLPKAQSLGIKLIYVSTHSHPKVAANGIKKRSKKCTKFQHTATRRWLQLTHDYLISSIVVSTHSHPKVAAAYPWVKYLLLVCFNTQPPEGGCRLHVLSSLYLRRFNTQPPEGGCRLLPLALFGHLVSTHSHPKVAADLSYLWCICYSRFNTQPPEGGCTLSGCNSVLLRCFNTQPPEGGCSSRYARKKQH